MTKKKQNKQNKKKRTGIPSAINRLDPELASEIRLAVEMGISDKQILCRYHICESQLDYAKRNGKNFNDLHSDMAVNIRKGRY